MTTYVLAPRARDDLGEIWDHTADHWGVDQADRYVRLLSAACSDLASGRRHGRSAAAIRANYLRHAVASHVIFYRPHGDGPIEVVRILHQRMDPDRHL